MDVAGRGPGPGSHHLSTWPTSLCIIKLSLMTSDTISYITSMLEFWSCFISSQNGALESFSSAGLGITG